MHQKLLPNPFFILVNNPKQAFLKIRFFEKGLSQSFKKVNFIFLLNPVPFNGQKYQKQKVPGTSDHLVFWSQNKFRKISLLAIYYLNKFDDVI